jgi:hypothetical protein
MPAAARAVNPLVPRTSAGSAPGLPAAGRSRLLRHVACSHRVFVAPWPEEDLRLLNGVNHYCTYFDQRYARAGLALWLSLRRHDPTAVLWVLALDDATATALRELAEPELRIVPLADLERDDPELAAARLDRTWVEYVFTLSPCWPRFLLARSPGLEVVTYVDADMAFFSSPAPLFDELAANDVLIVEHRFPDFLRLLESRGRFNVGVLCFRNSPIGRACLDDWRRRCLEWCHDRVEPERYADQKYLDAWPGRFRGVTVCQHPGVNLAPWNWMNHASEFSGDELRVDGAPLVVFHFARFQALGPARVDSGQLEYGVMPLRLRTWIYGRYWALWTEAGQRLESAAPNLGVAAVAQRGQRAAWKTRLLEFFFGSRWRRVGPWWVACGVGPGRYSGRALVWLRGQKSGPRSLPKK